MLRERVFPHVTSIPLRRIMMIVSHWADIKAWRETLEKSVGGIQQLLRRCPTLTSIELITPHGHGEALEARLRVMEDMWVEVIGDTIKFNALLRKV